MSTQNKTFLSQALALSKQNISNSIDECNIIIIGNEKSGKSTVFNLLFNSKKELVGINTLTVETGSMAVDINAIRRFLSTIK